MTSPISRQSPYRYRSYIPSPHLGRQVVWDTWIKWQTRRLHPISSHSKRSTRVDRITTNWPEDIFFGYDMQPKDRIPPYTLRHIIHVMSWGEQDPVSIRTRLHLHVPYFAESFFFHRLFLSHATSSSFFPVFLFLFFRSFQQCQPGRGLATARADHHYQQYLGGS